MGNSSVQEKALNVVVMVVVVLLIPGIVKRGFQKHIYFYLYYFAAAMKYQEQAVETK